MRVLTFSAKCTTFVYLNHKQKESVMTKMLFIGGLGAGELIIIALVILLLFGGKKIPELMRGLGKGVRSFKEGLNEAKEEANKIKEEVEKDN